MIEILFDVVWPILMAGGICFWLWALLIRRRA